jgi:hypothetical protein
MRQTIIVNYSVPKIKYSNTQRIQGLEQCPEVGAAYAFQNYQVFGAVALRVNTVPHWKGEYRHKDLGRALEMIARDIEDPALDLCAG